MHEPDLRDYLLPFLDVDDPVVIRMRHEPSEASARLLVALGAGWIVDEDAPVCVKRCGRRECLVKAVSAHDLTRIRLCVEATCPNEAERGSDHCRRCAEKQATPPRMRRTAAWDKADILGAIRQWATEHDGVPPRSSDWLRASDDWPNMSTVVRWFGRWSLAIEAAGFDPRYHSLKWAPASVLGEAAANDLGPDAAASSSTRALGTAGTRSGEAETPAAPNARTARLRVIQRFAAVREELDEMERELLEALEDEAA